MESDNFIDSVAKLCFPHAIPHVFFGGDDRHHLVV